MGSSYFCRSILKTRIFYFFPLQGVKIVHPNDNNFNLLLKSQHSYAVKFEIVIQHSRKKVVDHATTLTTFCQNYSTALQ
jgi:hypothetical protein